MRIAQKKGGFINPKNLGVLMFPPAQPGKIWGQKIIENSQLGFLGFGRGGCRPPAHPSLSRPSASRVVLIDWGNFLGKFWVKE